MQTLKSQGTLDIHAECTCDICAGALPHAQASGGAGLGASAVAARPARLCACRKGNPRAINKFGGPFPPVPALQLLEKMRRTIFCPIVASNVQSSRRLSEAVLSGCIPVFFGPPFHTLPLAQVGGVCVLVRWPGAACGGHQGPTTPAILLRPCPPMALMS